MEYSIYRFTLDLQDTASSEAIRIKEGDVNRRCVVSLTDGGKEYHISPNSYAKLVVKTASGETIQTNASVRENKISFDITPAISNSVGDGYGEILIYDSSGGRVYTPTFSIVCVPTLFSESYPETPSYPTRTVTIVLPSYSWIGEGMSFSQSVSVPGVTSHSKIDLQPTHEQLVKFHSVDLALVTENNNGTVTVYAIGDKPMDDITIQATVTEVFR